MRDIDVDGMFFNCCEQYMMFRKALLFKDMEALNAIMSSQDPSFQKKCGRIVKNFNVDKWNEICRDVVFDANYAKFTQHKDLKKKLIDTGNKHIVEASLTDKIWGIGMAVSDEDVMYPEKWRGTNWLGEEIMKVRKKILSEKQ